MNDNRDQAGRTGQSLGPDTRKTVRSETQTATVQTRHRAPDAHPDSPARVAGDVDEAREIPTDIVTRKEGEPDAVAQGPAAAPSMTDEEAGLQGTRPEGGIVPLQKRQD